MLLTLTLAILAAQDWPVLGHDVRRTNATTDEVRPPFKRRWVRNFADEGLMYGIQPVVQGGRVYIGTMRGVLHAIDDATGRDLWTCQVNGGIFHAAAVDGGTVFVCGGDGALHAVRDGKLIWTFPTGVALWNAPLVLNGTVYFGGRDGFLYAVKDGKLIWKLDLGAPIVHSPAIDPDAHRVYVGAEDMTAYAIDLDKGALIWKSDRLQGFTFAGYHPVVLPAGGVVFTTRPFNRGWEGEADKTLEALLKKFYGTAPEKPDRAAFPDWRFKPDVNKRFEAAVLEKQKEPGHWKAQFDFIRDQLTSNPHRQTVFLLDGATGKSRGVVPVVYCESNNGTQAPPVVTADGRVAIQVAVGVLHSRQKDVAWLDPKTGDLELVRPEKGGTGLLIIPDEQAALSASGPTLILTRQDEVHGFDGRRNLREAWFANIHEPDKDEKAHLPARILRGEPLPVGREYVFRGMGVYGGGSGVDSPSVVAGKSIYYIPQHEGNCGACLVAYEMTDTKSPLKEPVATAPADPELIAQSNWDFDYLNGRKMAVDPGPSKAEAKAIDVDKLIWEAEAVESTPSPTLTAAVEELLSKDWAPLAFPEGKYPGEGYWAFSDPSEIYLTLGLAWPHLSPELRAKVKLWEVDPVATASLDGRKGERRERYSFVQTQKTLDGRIRPPGLARLYPLWLYAHRSGDWAWLEKNWPRLKSLATAVDARRNDLLSGLLAYCRIADHVKDAEAVKLAEPLALAAMKARIEFELAHPKDAVYVYGWSGTLRTGPARWTFLTAELGRLLRASTPEVQAALVARYVDFLRPSWPLAWGILTEYGHENCTTMPQHVMSHFQAKAWLAGSASLPVDIPWCRGDLYYIQKLAISRSCGKPERWISLRMQ